MMTSSSSLGRKIVVAGTSEVPVGMPMCARLGGVLPRCSSYAPRMTEQGMFEGLDCVINDIERD
jgi:hypothetical protein